MYFMILYDVMNNHMMNDKFVINKIIFLSLLFLFYYLSLISIPTIKMFRNFPIEKIYKRYFRQ